ncbi:hypothetical protein [Rubellimicrobium rubrum]|uniref:hypothetical protein n=1 Tax=Rubellimicrobium rubrum TaxID=2585369 RepID=UPI001FE277B6|nr:hypothetical protein [Rubellimicrobium rubrum]
MRVFGRELVAVDGTRIKAVNNKDRNVIRAALTTFVEQADEKLARYLKRLDEGDADEDEANTGGRGPSHKDPRLVEKLAAVRGKRERHKALLEELDRTNEDQIWLNDPDSRAMARMTQVGVGFNVQVVVDAKHKLIAEQEVHSQVVDMGLLAATASAAMEALGVERIEAVAARGTFKIEDVEACEAVGGDALWSQAGARPVRAGGLLPQGGVPVRPWSGHLLLSRWSDAPARTLAREREGRHQQPRSL